MRKNIFLSYLKLIIVALLTTMMIFSCKDQDETFKQYVVEGGISYLGAVSGAKVRIGKERLEVSFSVADPATSKVGIFWNDYQDSLMINVSPGEQVKQIIELSEGTYTLNVKSYDSKGNSSNPVELAGRTVGDTYINSLSYRGIDSKITKGGNDLIIDWSVAEVGLGARLTDLIYTSTNGTEKRILVNNEDDITEISDYKQGTPFRRTTYYSVDNLWLDTIIPGWQTDTTLVIDKSIGSVIDFSSENGDNKAAKFYDGNMQNTWETSNNYPEYAVIDMGIEIPVVGIGVLAATQYTNGRADPRAPTKVLFEASLDNETWVNLGEYDYNNSLYAGQRYFIVPETKARYVRFTGLECTSAPYYSGGIGGPNTTKMFLSELSIYFKLTN